MSAWHSACVCSRNSISCLLLLCSSSFLARACVFMCRHVGTTMLVPCQKTTVGASPRPPLCDRVSLFFLPQPLCINQTSCPRTPGDSPVFVSHPPVGVTLFQMFTRRVILTQRLNVRTLLDCSSIKTLKQCTKLSYIHALCLEQCISPVDAMPVSRTMVCSLVLKAHHILGESWGKTFCTASLELTQHLGAHLSGWAFCTVV